MTTGPEDQGTRGQGTDGTSDLQGSHVSIANISEGHTSKCDGDLGGLLRSWPCHSSAQPHNKEKKNGWTQNYAKCCPKTSKRSPKGCGALITNSYATPAGLL